MECPEPDKHGKPPYGCARCEKRGFKRHDFGYGNRMGSPLCYDCYSKTGELIRAEDEAFEEPCVKCGRLVRSKSLAAQCNPIFGIHMPPGQIYTRLCYACFAGRPTHVACWRCGGTGSIRSDEPEVLPVTRWADPIV